MRILLADDDPTLLAFLNGIVTRLKLEPVLASDGERAWELMQELAPRLVITDWLMPKMTGVELCRKIRSDGRPDAAPYIIMMTSLSAKEHVVEGFAAGADDYLAKPSDAREVACRVAVGVRNVTERMAVSERAHREIIEKCQRVIGADHPDLVESIDALAGIYTEQGAFVKARAFLRRQVAIAEKAGNEIEVFRLKRLLDDLRAEEDATLVRAEGAP